MSTENVSMEQHLTFVNKMLERVRGTDLEPIWEKLHSFMTKINDLNDEKKTALDEMIKKIIGKIEHFKRISEQRLEDINAENKSDHELDAQFETSPATEISFTPNSQPEQPSKIDHEFIKPRQKLKKFKRYRMPVQKHPSIVMSPRGDNLPVMRIRLSEIYNRKRQKEERKKNKKTKDMDVLKAAIEQYERSKELPVAEQNVLQSKSVENLPEILPATDNLTAVENSIQNDQDLNIPMEVERINEISSVHDVMHNNRFSELGLKECTIRLEKCSPEKAKIVSEPKESQVSKPESSKSINKPVFPSTSGTKPTESLAKIPIEKSKSVVQNGSKKIKEQELICIEDSDDDETMQGQVSTTAKIDKNSSVVINNSKDLKKLLNCQEVNIKSSKSIPKKPRLESQETQQKDCIVTVKTVDLSAIPQTLTESPSKPNFVEPNSLVTPQTLFKKLELSKNVIKSAPVPKLHDLKRIRNSIDTIPSPKVTQSATVRQSARQAIRRNSLAARTIDFGQQSYQQPNGNESSIKILSVETILPPADIIKKPLNAQTEVATTKKFPNARKSTKSNKVLPSHELSSCNQTPNKNNVSQVTSASADYLKLNSKTVSNSSDPKNVAHVIKTEPQSPKGYMTPPMTEIPTSIMLIEAQKDKKLVLLSSAATLNKIRPWLKASEHRKFLRSCETMLGNGFCLSALFKCMGSTCSYYTNNPTFFLRHLKVHQEKQANDMKYFSQCAYCNVINDNPKALVQHISDTHGYNRYQCAYCFYRSCDFHIHTHHKLFHPLKSEVIIECKPLRKLDIEKEFSNALRNVMTVCRYAACCVCKSRFYNIKNYENHFKAYPTVPSSRCITCKFEINQETFMDHLKECHKFGDFNCAFCSFGSDSSDSIKIHLSNLHYDKPMLYYDRTKQSQKVDLMAKGSTKVEDVLKSIVLKKLIHQEQTNKKNIKIFNDQHELDNAHNINTGLLDKHT